MAARKTTKRRKRPGGRTATARPRPRTAAKARRKALKKKASPPKKAAPRTQAGRAKARKKSAKPRRTRAARRPAARSRRAPARKPARKSAPARRKPVARAKPAARTAKARRPAAPATKRARPAAKRPRQTPAAVIPALAGLARPKSHRRPAAPPDLGRQRRTLPDEERLDQHEPAQIEPMGDERQLLSARSGHDELRHRLKLHTETSPEITAGDVDASWEGAYATGDEAPGGDNPTPDQDRVDEIGKALGISYADDQELQGGDEITERDRHRWEFDPASSDDWPHNRRDD